MYVMYDFSLQDKGVRHTGEKLKTEKFSQKRGRGSWVIQFVGYEFYFYVTVVAFSYWNSLRRGVIVSIAGSY